jgi:hypothetical protein
MANLATETGVRTKFQLTDTERVPTSLITASIDDAHTELLRFLDPECDLETPASALIMGETLLAGANVFRALAGRDAFDQKQAAIGGQRIDAGKRFTALNAIADFAERQAWYLLEPYVLAVPARVLAAGTDTVAVLGGE